MYATIMCILEMHLYAAANNWCGILLYTRGMQIHFRTRVPRPVPDCLVLLFARVVALRPSDIDMEYEFSCVHLCQLNRTTLTSETHPLH